MGLLDPVRKVVGAADDWQRRHRWAGVPYAVQKKFGNDNANLLVVGLAWYGFTAIFPLLLIVVTVFGDIGAASLGTGIINTMKQFPVIGTLFATPKSLHGSLFGLIVGLVGLLYGAQGVTQTAQQAMATVWDVPQTERTGFVPRLGRSLAGLVTIGGAFLVNASITTYISGGTQNWAIRIPVVVGLLIINVLLYLATFYLLTPKVIGPRGLIPGSVLGGVAFTALLTVGTGLLTHEVKNASNTYGTFAAVIGIVTVLLLLAKVSLYAAELNPVLSRNLYPRALPLIKNLTDADKRVLAGEVYQEQRTDDQAIGVGFGDDAAEEAAADAQQRTGKHRQTRSEDSPESDQDGEAASEDSADGSQVSSRGNQR